MALAAFGGGKVNELQLLEELLRRGEGGLGHESEVLLLLNHGDSAVVRKACEILAKSGPYYADELAGLLSSSSAEKRCFAAGALGTMGVAAAGHAPTVSKLVRDENDSVRAAALVALGRMEYIDEISAVEKCLSDHSSGVVAGAITALALLGDNRCVAQVATKLSDSDKAVKSAAVAYLSKNPDAPLAHADAICALLGDSDATVRQSAVSLFTNLKERGAPMVPKVAKFLQHSDLRIQASAALALGGLGPVAASQADAVAKLLRSTEADKSQVPLCCAGVAGRLPPTQTTPACAAASALAAMQQNSYGPDLAQLLTQKNKAEVVIAALEALAELGNKEEVAIAALLKDGRPQVCSAACAALGKIAASNGAEEWVVTKVLPRINDKSPVVRVAALEALAQMGDEHGEANADSFRQLLLDRSPPVRCAAMRALAAAGPRGQCFAPDVCRAMYDGPPSLRMAAAESLANMGERGAAFAEELLELLSGDPDDAVRVAVLQALGKMGDSAKRHVSYLEEVQVGDASEKVREAARAAISGLTLLSLAE